MIKNRVFALSGNGSVIKSVSCSPQETDRVHDELWELPDVVLVETQEGFVYRDED